MYLPCGDRRASVCPPCAETYRADTYQLIRAGLAGGKGMPESVSIHPCVFATFTAPSFGPVHTRVEQSRREGRPMQAKTRRPATARTGVGCPADSGTRRTKLAWAGRCVWTATTTTPPSVWNAHAPELWRRTIIALRRQLDKLAKAHGARVRLSYAKVAEFQRRGLIHFHAIFRLDGVDPDHPERTVPPHPAITADVLADLIRQVAASAWFATVPHPAKPNGWDITWGAQIDPQIVTAQPAAARSPTSRSPRTWPSTPPNPPSRSGCRLGSITADNAKAYATPHTPRGAADRCLPADRRTRSRGLPGAAPMGAHARLPRPLRHQEPPLLHHHARPAQRPPGLAPPPASTRQALPGHDHRHRNRSGMGWARLAHHRRRPPGPVGRRPRPRSTPDRPSGDVFAS